MLQLLRENLHRAQNRMKKYADLKRTDREFNIGDFVYLRLQPYRQMSLSQRHNLKLSPRFYGPFKILQRIGSVAYKLDLPSTSLLHPVFHVSQLKRQLGTRVAAATHLPPTDSHGVLRPEPVHVLNRRSRKVRNRAVTDLLIQWQGQPPEDATWIPYHQLALDYPHLVGKVF
ncbi:Transposon Tf2-9 polyprotein [Morella rubra]|uniref:Transposon Tf2-9 polyprotein n=1 Tax=Morella rubra TaxID=262757 RepID=A0A6A1WQP5_9ROSI|nr:Transposon Tf2-9 polyprotein [Morella rubra]